MKKIILMFSLALLFIGMSQGFVPQKVDAAVINLPISKAFHGYGISLITDIEGSYGGSGSSIQIESTILNAPQNILTYDTTTNTLTFDYYGAYGSSAGSYNYFTYRAEQGYYVDVNGNDWNGYSDGATFIPTENDAAYWTGYNAAKAVWAKTDQQTYGNDLSPNYPCYGPSIGVYPSGHCISHNITVTKGIPGSDTWNVVHFQGQWTIPNLDNSLYKNSGGIFITMADHNPYLGGVTGGVDSFVWQFNASAMSSYLSSYSPPITIVNGKAFSVTLPGTNGKFVGTNTTYGTITGTASGINTILSGTLSGVPSSYTDLTIGSDTIKIRGVAAPSTSAATVSFY